MTTSTAENLAGRARVEKPGAERPAAEKLGAEKKDEKVEKRRALGRGLESLLPGPRVVGSPESRLASHEAYSVVDRPAPQGLTAKSTGVGISSAEAVPFPGPSESAVQQTAIEEAEAERTGARAPLNLAPRAFNEGISTPQAAADRAPANLIVDLPIELIDKNPYQTRTVFAEETLVELRDSIKEHGVVQPVVVRPAEVEGRYLLVLGERRLRASRMAGKDTIPAQVRRLSPQQAAEMTVLENVVREDLNPIEQAEAFRVLSLEFKLTQAQIGERVGVSRESVSNYMRLLRLPQKVRDYMVAGRLSFSDAREILRLENEEHIDQVAEEVVTHKLKWHQIEDRVMQLNGTLPVVPGGESKRKNAGARWMDPNVRQAQMDMERTLGLRVRICDRNGKGRIVIEYTSVDDYERVTSMLRGKQ